MADYQFNAQGIDPEWGSGFGTTLSKGWFQVHIERDQSDENSKKNGGHLKMFLKVEAVQNGMDAAQIGQEAMLMLNLWHSDPGQRDRANSQLAAIMWCVGIGAIQRTNDLWGRSFWIENDPQKRKVNEQERIYNNFVGVRNMQGAEPGKVAPTQGGGFNAGQPPGPPQGGAPAPAGQSYAPPNAPAAPPAGQPGPGWNSPPQPPQQPQFQPPQQPQQNGGWGGQPQQQPPGYQQPQQQPPQAVPMPSGGNWQPQGGAPGGAPPAAPGNWGQTR